MRDTFIADLTREVGFDAACEDQPSRRQLITSFGKRLVGATGLLLTTGATEAFGRRRRRHTPSRPRPPRLHYPLQGRRRVLLGFGRTWVWQQCGGRYKRHVGTDLQASPGDAVFAAEPGHIKLAANNDTWGGVVVIEHRDYRGRLYTTTSWHLASFLRGGYVRRGQRIGVIADISAKTVNHLHFGLRLAPYSAVAQRGALPRTGCDGDPGFPEYFVRGV